MKQSDSLEQQQTWMWAVQSLLSTLLIFHNVSNPLIVHYVLHSMDDVIQSVYQLPSPSLQPLTEVLLERVNEVANQSKTNYLSVELPMSFHS